MRLRACSFDDLADGQMTTVSGGPEPIALYRVAGSYYATSDVCSHGQSSLTGEGELDGFAIECGWHFGRFDIRNGAVLALPCTKPIKAYGIIVEGNDVFVVTGD
jgi:nitrite reductase/ring-hydroxylating ferredoxin subunit